MHVDDLIAQRQADPKHRRLMIDRAPQAVIKRVLVREVRQFGGLFESRIPIIAKDIAETLELSQAKRKEHE